MIHFADPHVRIVGRNSDVSKAKDLVLNSLDSRVGFLKIIYSFCISIANLIMFQIAFKGSRVIMKMDISFTDHSYIIGRQGNTIKNIMEDTMTHIHFPDSNRSSQTEKSNQVSLCGSLEGVEKARARVRVSNQSWNKSSNKFNISWNRC